MVLDPFTALSVASNVVQFVEFGSKVLSAAVEIYKSKDGTANRTLDLETVVIDLSLLSEKFAKSSCPQQDGLRKLAAQCKNLADDLIQLLQKLKPQGRSNRIFESGLLAIKLQRKSKEIAAYSDRLDKLRAQMTARLSYLLSEQQCDMLDILRQQCDRHTQFNLDAHMNNTKLKGDIASMRADLSSTAKTQDLESLVLRIDQLSKEWSAATRLGRVLESLSYESQYSRVSSVEKAHAQNYQWAFDDDYKRDRRSPALSTWLRHGEDIFWVTGKPGSGKSTFLKFIDNNTRTLDLLKDWAGSGKLVKASHFFWIAGTPMQRSLQGLLQSLLFEVLCKCPILLDLLLPESRDYVINSIRSQRPWSMEELQKTFKDLETLDQLDVKFIFFIDGLDEYSGDHQEILEMFRSLARLPNFKLCISSRDWNVFQDAFQDSPKLRLEDLTRDDIRAFVKTNFEDDRRFQALRDTDERYSQLIDQIVENAQGVFLWVFFVVRSLKRGFIEGDTIMDLLRRLNELPKDLEEFFLLMLKSVESVYHSQAAEILLVLANPSSFDKSLLTISFFDEDDHLFGTNCQPVRWKSQELESRLSLTKKRVQARCRDLLAFPPTNQNKISDLYGGKVDFVHRTAKDFVRSDAIRRLLESRMRPSFNALRFICQANIAKAKLIPVGDTSLREQRRLDIIALHVLHAAEAYDKSLAPKEKSSSMEWLLKFSKAIYQEGIGRPRIFHDPLLTALPGREYLWLFTVALNVNLTSYVDYCISHVFNREFWSSKLGPCLVKCMVKMGMSQPEDSLEVFEMRFVLGLLRNRAKPWYKKPIRKGTFLKIYSMEIARTILRDKGLEGSPPDECISFKEHMLDFIEYVFDEDEDEDERSEIILRLNQKVEASMNISDLSDEEDLS